MDTISSEMNVMAMDTISIETKPMPVDTVPSKSLVCNAVIPSRLKLLILVSVKHKPEGARSEEEDINMETSAEMKHADEGDKDESIGDK